MEVEYISILLHVHKRPWTRSSWCSSRPWPSSPSSKASSAALETAAGVSVTPSSRACPSSLEPYHGAKSTGRRQDHEPSVSSSDLVYISAYICTYTWYLCTSYTWLLWFSTAYPKMKHWDEGELSLGGAGTFWCFTWLFHWGSHITRKTEDGGTWEGRSGRERKNAYPSQIWVKRLVLTGKPFDMIELTLGDMVLCTDCLLIQIWKRISMCKSPKLLLNLFSTAKCGSLQNPKDSARQQCSSKIPARFK